MTISTASTDNRATKRKPAWRKTNKPLVATSPLPCAAITTCKPNKEGRNRLRPGVADLTETLFLDSRPGSIPSFHVVEDWDLNAADGGFCFDFSNPWAHKFRAYDVSHDEARAFYRRARSAERSRLFIDVDRLIEWQYEPLYPAVAMLDGSDLSAARHYAGQKGKALDAWIRDALDAAAEKARKCGKTRKV